MKIKRYTGLATVGMVFVSFVSAWAFFGPYGKLRLQPRGEKRMTIEVLEKGWQDYDVYFAGPWIGRPSAIMFDPRRDDRKLVPHRWWVPVKTQKELDEVIWGIKVDQVGFDPRVWRILGPDNQFYGYMYTAWHHVVIKAVDARTLWVDDIPLPRLEPASVERAME